MNCFTFNLLLLLVFSTNNKAASFDCSANLTITENTICSNTALNLLDEQLSTLYSLQLKELNKADKLIEMSNQGAWLRVRNNCESNIICLKATYVSRIEELSFPSEKIVKTKVKFAHQPKLDSFAIEKQCDFSNIQFSPNLIVYAGGGYSGNTINRQIDQSGHQTTKFKVAVNSPSAPVALILGAYEPSVWEVKWTEKTKISAVYATGHHRQVVIGLPNNVPVITSGASQTPRCRGNFYVSHKKLNKINSLSKRLFNKKVSLVRSGSTGKLSLGEAVTSKTHFITNSDNTIERYIAPSLPLAGEKGLENLVSTGFLRKATKQDSNNWAKLKLNHLKQNLSAVTEGDLESRYKRKFSATGYVILKEMRIPAGLFGAHRTNFFLETGVPFPEGELGHSNLYDFNTMKCHGSLCKH